jgi:hypothetical protein
MARPKKVVTIDEVIQDAPNMDDLYEVDPEQFLAAAVHGDAIDPELATLLDDEPEVEEPVVEEEVMKPIKAKRVKNYINNADLLVQLAISNANGEMSKELVKMFQTLCDRYGAKANFGGYSYIDDMKAYAMYMLVRTWKAFKCEKSQNPFAFFTQCIKHSFIQCLNKERNERDIRDQLLIDAGLNPSYSFGGGDSDSSGGGGEDSYD